MENAAKFLETLGRLPLRLCLALAATGTVILYGPNLPGLNLTVARTWPWIGPATVLAWFLVTFILAARAGALGAKIVVARLEATPPASLRLTVQPQINKTWWGAAVQQDGSTVTQIAVDFSAHNPTNRMVHIRAARLIRPKVPVELVLPTVWSVADPNGGSMSSERNPIPPNATSSARVMLMARRELARRGRFLRVTIGVTDQNGHEYRLKVRLWPMPSA